MTFTPRLVLGTASSIVVVAAVVSGLMALGSPSDERARRMDSRRVLDLQEIASATDLFWTRNDTLPASLQHLTTEPGVELSTADPETGIAYQYQAVDSIEYELCAVFESTSGQLQRIPDTDRWAHGEGRQCFQLEAQEVGRETERSPGG